MFDVLMYIHMIEYLLGYVSTDYRVTRNRAQFNALDLSACLAMQNTFRSHYKPLSYKCNSIFHFHFQLTLS